MNGMWRSHLSLHGLHTLAVVSWSPPVTTLEAEAGPGREMGQNMDQVPLGSCIKLVAAWKIKSYKYMETLILCIHVNIMYYLLHNVVHN